LPLERRGYVTGRENPDDMALPQHKVVVGGADLNGG